MEKTVDLVCYDNNGTRQVIGEAVVKTDKDGNIIARASVIPSYSRLFEDAMAPYSLNDVDN